MNTMASKRHLYHYELHWIFENSDLKRCEIARILGMTRKTLYDWEYKKTKTRMCMVEKVAAAAGIPIEKIPAYIRQKAADAAQQDFNAYDRAHTKKISKLKPSEEATQSATATPQAPIDPLEAVNAKGETLEDRIARRKPTDNPLTLARRAKEDAIIAARNPKPTPKANPSLTPHGGHAKLPTTAKRGARVGEVQSLGDTRNIPFPDDYLQPAGDSRIPKQYINLVNFPDLVYEAKQTMKPYEVRYIPRHKVPYPGEAGILLRPEAWYTVNTTGKMRSASTQVEAKALAEQLRIEDDKAIAEFM